MSEGQQSATYHEIIRDEIPGSWRQWARGIIGAYAGYAFIMDILLLIHAYVHEIAVFGDPLAGIPAWKLPVDTIIWAGALYWLYQGGFLDDSGNDENQEVR